MSRRLIAAASLSLAALALSGCGSIIPSPEKIAEDALKEGVEQAVEDATGTSVDIDPTALPEGFPDLPTPEGTLISSLVGDGIFSLTYLLDDESAVTTVEEALLADGYEVTADSSGDLNVFVAQGPEWTVSLTWYHDGEGVALSYGAVPTPAS